MQTIDVWAQIMTPRMANTPWLETLLRWNGQTPETSVPSVKSTLAAMDAADVGISLLSAWYGPQGDLITNEEVQAQISQAPDRFRGLISTDITNPMKAVRTIKEYAQDPSFVGVRIVPWLWDLPPDDRRYYPLYTACVEMGLPLCTQIGHTGPLKRSETGRPIPYLENVLLDFPELTVVGGHLGFPWLDELFSLSVKFPNLYIDTSAYALHRLPPVFVERMKTVWQNKVMFGTNWPMLSPNLCLKGLNDLGLNQDQREAFLFETAKRVFKI